MSPTSCWLRTESEPRRHLAAAAVALATFASCISAASLGISRVEGGDEVELDWHAAEDRAYQLQASGDLVDWRPFGPEVLGKNERVAVRDDVDDRDRAFYRLQSSRLIPVSTGSELTAAVTAAEPGDTIVLKDGIWKNQQLTVLGNGTKAHPVRIRAETPGEVVFTGNSSLRIRGSHLVVEGISFRDGHLTGGHVIYLDGDHLRLTQTLIDSYNPPDRETRYFWVSLRGKHNQVDHCTFRGMDHSGVTLVVWRDDSSPDHHLIRRNYFADRPQGTDNGWETIRIGTSDHSLSDSHTIVEENLFERCDGEIEIISNKSGRNIYRRNTFRASRGALTLRHGDACVVDSNFFLGESLSGTGGIRVIGEDHLIINNYIEGTRGRGGAAIAVNSGIPDGPVHGYFAAHRTLIAFNTIVDVSGPHLHLADGYGSGDRSVLPAEVTIANNLFEGGSQTTGDLAVGEAGPDLKAEGNLAYRRNPGSLPLSGVTILNPRLERGEGGLWRPRADSPALGAATGTYPQVEYDMDGQPRSTPKNVGSDQHSPLPIVNRPLFPHDVGPLWAP